MKVIFLMRVDAYYKRGGDTVQIEKYVEELNNLGIDASISTDLNEDITDADIIHLVNIDRPLETYYFFKNAKRLGKKIVLSPIHHSYQHIDLHETYGRYGVLKSFNLILKDYWTREKMKNVLRVVLNKKLRSIRKDIKEPVFEQQQLILNNVDGIALIAEGEGKAIEEDFNIKIKNSIIVPNGVSFNNTTVNNKIEKEIDVLVVGRIESRKNQINIIKALKDTEKKVTFVGKANPNHKKYYKEFIKLVNKHSNIEYITEVSHDEINKLYKKSKVHLSASWFEVSPLVDIEALYNGCTVVASEHSFSKSYLGKNVYYVAPTDLKDIKTKVLLALKQPINEMSNDKLHQTFNWKNSALILKEFYTSLVKVNGGDQNS